MFQNLDVSADLHGNHATHEQNILPSDNSKRLKSVGNNKKPRPGSSSMFYSNNGLKQN